MYYVLCATMCYIRLCTIYDYVLSFYFNVVEKSFKDTVMLNSIYIVWDFSTHYKNLLSTFSAGKCGKDFIGTTLALLLPVRPTLCNISSYLLLSDCKTSFLDSA